MILGILRKLGFRKDIRLYHVYKNFLLYIQANFIYSYFCICAVHVIRSLNCQYQHMYNFNVTG